MTVLPHLYFRTDAEAALRFYEECGLGRVTGLRRHDGQSGAVLYAELQAPGVRIAVSDGDDSEPMKGCALLLEQTDLEVAGRLFAALSVGGRITVAFEEKPWGWYGNFTDRFGVQWAVLVNEPAR